MALHILAQLLRQKGTARVPWVLCPSSNRGGALSPPTRNLYTMMKTSEAYLKIPGPKKEQKQLNSLYNNFSLEYNRSYTWNFLILCWSSVGTEHKHQNSCIYIRKPACVVISLGWEKNKCFIVLSGWKPFFVPSPIITLHVYSLPKTSVSSNAFFFTLLGFCDLKQVNVRTTDFGLSYLKMYCLIYWYEHMHFYKYIYVYDKVKFYSLAI